MTDEQIETLAQRFYIKKKQKQQLKPDSLVATQVSQSHPSFAPKELITIDLNSVTSEEARKIGNECEWLCYQTTPTLGLSQFLSE